MRSILAGLGLILSLQGCAFLHHVQLGDIDNTAKGTPFEVKVSETGIDLQEAKNIGKALSRNAKNNKAMDDIAGAIALFQMGPRTGNLVYNPDYARNIGQMILAECPSGRITGITAIRESAKYPVISGEIVRIRGFCDRKG